MVEHTILLENALRATITDATTLIHTDPKSNSPAQLSILPFPFLLLAGHFQNQETIQKIGTGKLLVFGEMAQPDSDTTATTSIVGVAVRTFPSLSRV